MVEITYAPLQARWATELAAIERAAFPTAGIAALMVEEDILALCENFPDGGFVALDGETPVGMGVGILIDFDFDEPNHSLDDLTGENSCGNHSDNADWYYGVTIAVDANYRRLGIRTHAEIDQYDRDLKSRQDELRSRCVSSLLLVDDVFSV